jgi:Ser/Thr protein kinase RdoA (MazF antagonist)
VSAFKDADAHAREVLRSYDAFGAMIELVTMGHINRTYTVTHSGARHILQRLSTIFAPEVHDDIEAVTAHLERHGVRTPRLVRNRAGELWTRDESGGIWRMMTFIEGILHARAEAPELCRAAGELVGRFHVAVGDLRHDFRHRRPGLHDTARHLAHLREVLKTHKHHPSFAMIEPLGREILDLASALPSLAGAPKHVTHNDLKITNVVFSPAGEAVALIDLDTLAEMSIPIELGDAFRSWCNPKSEDAGAVAFSMPHLEAGLAGYAKHGRAIVSRADRELLPHAISTIALELAARFASDALEESYFGWDKTRFPSASAHNLMRARTQLSLGKSAAEAVAEITRAVSKHLA